MLMVGLKAKYIVPVLIVVGLGFLIWGGGATHDTPVPNWAVQDLINHEIPKTIKGITATRMDIVLSDHADVTMDIEGEKFGKGFKMTLHAIGQPDIKHSKNGALYFYPEKIDIQNFVYTGEAPGSILKKGAERYLEGHPNMQRALTDAAPHIETWMTKSAEAGAVLVLHEMPIYRYKGTKGFFLNAAVQTVHIQDGQLYITWSLWELTERAVIGLVVVVVSMAFFVLAILADL